MEKTNKEKGRSEGNKSAEERGTKARPVVIILKNEVKEFEENK